MYRIICLLFTILFIGCSNQVETVYPLSVLLDLSSTEGDAPDLNAVYIKGNSKGVTKIIEARFIIKGDRILQSNIEMLSREETEDWTTVWFPPISDRIRIANYKKTYDFIVKCQKLFENGTFDQFFSQVASEPDRSLIVLNGQDENAHVGIEYRYATDKTIVSVEDGFREIELLHRLFPSAEFKNAGSEYSNRD